MVGCFRTCCSVPIKKPDSSHRKGGIIAVGGGRGRGVRRQRNEGIGVISRASVRWVLFLLSPSPVLLHVVCIFAYHPSYIPLALYLSLFLVFI